MTRTGLRRVPLKEPLKPNYWRRNWLSRYGVGNWDAPVHKLFPTLGQEPDIGNICHPTFVVPGPALRSR